MPYHCDSPGGNNKRYRVLSLDGGGIKGAYTASVLSSLEAMTRKRVGEHFDLITGTSTGGIIAIAIGLGIPMADILDLYVSKGTTIFPPPKKQNWRRPKEWFRRAVKPKHSQQILRQALFDVFGKQMFGHSKNRLVIPAFNAVNGQIHLFKTPHCSDYRQDLLEAAVDVALSTAAAPTYFSAFTDERGRAFVDGGVWANCPVLVGIAEAVGKLGWSMDNLDILSVGTTDEPIDVTREQRDGGLLQWCLGITNLQISAQVRGTLGLATALVKDRLHRIDVFTRPGRFSLDNAREVSELRALGENSARQVPEEILSRFFSFPIVPFEPCYSDASSKLNGSASVQLLEPQNLDQGT